MHFKSNWMSNRPPRKCRLLNVGDSILPTMSVKTFEKLEMIAKGWLSQRIRSVGEEETLREVTVSKDAE